MANEHRGDLSELVLIRALEEIGYVYRRNLHWRTTPPGLQLCESDVTVGCDPVHPDVIFQVCSSGYEGGSQKKFWRDLGELIEARRVFPKCRVINVLFEPGAKRKLLEIYQFVTDGVVLVHEVEKGKELLERIAQLSERDLPRDSEEKYTVARRAISARRVAGLAAAVRQVLRRPLATWTLDHAPGGGPLPETAIQLRKAILTAALFVTNRDFRTCQAFLEAGVRGRSLPAAPFLPSLRDLGICNPALGRVYRLADDNLLGALRHLTVPVFVRVACAAISVNPGSRLFAYVELIQQLRDLIPRWFAALLDNFSSLQERTFLTAALVANFNDRDHMLAPGDSRSGEPWLFRRLLDLIRAADGKHFAIGIPRFDPVFQRAGLPALRFLISDYIAGRRALEPPEAEVAATVLIPELRRIADLVRPSLLEKFGIMVRRSEYQQRLLTYRGFDLFPTILREQYSIEPATLVPPVVEHLKVRGAATSAGHVSGDTISMWQSASEQGVAHKVKELVGRMGLCCLTVTVDARKHRTFRFRRDLPNRVLYTDGKWGEREIEAVRAGVFTAVRRVW